MMKRNMSEIKKELKERGIKEIGKEELSNLALVFAIEDLVRETKKPFMIKGVETLVEGLEKK